MREGWNPWHGCRKLSEGCANCYVYRMDAEHGRDPTHVHRTAAFGLPIRKNRKGEYRVLPGSTLWTCFSSDFFLEEADEWRQEAWAMMAARPDVEFIFITKRIHRISAVLPPDWGDGYSNVHIGCTCENQRRADERLPLFLAAPIRHRFIVCEPLLEPIDLSPYLDHRIEEVSAGGESGPGARVCDYAWVMGIRDACAEAGVAFHFHQTGANFRRDGRSYIIPRSRQHEQAKRAGIDLSPAAKYYTP